MKSINKSLLVAAVLSTALSALAQTGGGTGGGSGSGTGSGTTNPNPSNEGNTTNPSNPYGERTDDARRRAGEPNTTTGPDAVQGSNPNSVQDSNDVSRTDDMNQPKRKRSFWDRLFGRNKHLDSNGTTTSPEQDSSGRQIERQP